MKKNGINSFLHGRKRRKKLLLTMKITIVLLLAGLFHVSATVYSQQTRFNLKIENKQIADILKEIEESSNFRFFYIREQVNVERKVSLQVKDATVEQILKQLFSGEGINFKVMDDNLVLLTPSKSSSENQTLAQQQKTVKGQVVDEGGDPVPGVSVVIKGTTQGTITDVDGNYILSNVPDDATLMFSFIGFKTQEVAVNGRTKIDLTLEVDVIGLDEVVSIGYSTVRKKDLTGSVGSVESKDISVRGTTTALEAIQGQVAGVNIKANSGRAGTDYKIEIRGMNSLKGGNPLYVVDGIVTNDINFLNPQDIQSIDILKDASSTAIYGSRGSNGVVIVTTKQASNVKDQKPTISYDGYYGVVTPARVPDFMDGDTFWDYREDAFLGQQFAKGKDITSDTYDQAWVDHATELDNCQFLYDKRNGLTPPGGTDYDYPDWVGLLTTNGSQQNHWLSISGKSKSNMSYIFGLGYQDDKGIMINEGYTRYNFKASINHKISEKWTAGTNVNVAITENELADENIYRYGFSMAPVAPAYAPTGYEIRNNKTGELYEPGELIMFPGGTGGLHTSSSMYNPLISMKEYRDNLRRLSVMGNIYLQYSPITDLHLKTTLSPQILTSREGVYVGSNTKRRKGLNPAAELHHKDVYAYTWDNQITYDKSFNGDHKLNVMGLYSMYGYTYERSFIEVENLPFESLWHNVGSVAKEDIVQVGSSYSKVTLLSLLARVNYSFRDKYLLTASIRSDGSSKLAEGNKWDAFPSFAAAWRLSEEGFMQGASWISNMKLRLSYGFTGNNNISPYSTMAYPNNQRYYQFGSNSANGFAPSNMANHDLTWEKTREINLGFDFGFVNNRINGSIDLYNKLSDGLLLNRNLPKESGWSSITTNIGSVSNKGIEIALNTVNIKTPGFMWQTTFTFARNINAIEELYGSDEDDIGNKWFIGEPVRVNYTYVFDGIYNKEEAAAAGEPTLEGQARVRDLDNNDAIDDEDRTIIGTPEPDWTGSFTSTMTFKGFDFNLSLYTLQGSQVFSYAYQTFTSMKSRHAQKLNVNYYMAESNIRPARMSNEYPMPRNAGPYWDKEYVGYYKDVSFTKIKNISLGYSLSPKTLSGLKIKQLRLYVNVLNPFVFTKYGLFDPEWAGGKLSGEASGSRNFGGGLSTITYQFGVNVKF